MKTKQTKKILFQLNAQDRHILINQILEATRNHLVDLKLSGVKLKDIAIKTGLPKQRISEIYHKRYIGEDSIAVLVNHGYIPLPALYSLDITPDQKTVLQTLLGLESRSPAKEF